jgi:hypothetical protein
MLVMAILPSASPAMQAIQVAMPAQRKPDGAAPAIPDVFSCDLPPVEAPMGGFIGQQVPVNDLGNPSPVADPGSPPPMRYGAARPAPPSFPDAPAAPPVVSAGGAHTGLGDPPVPATHEGWETPPARQQAPTVFQDGPSNPHDTTASVEVESYLAAMQNAQTTKPPKPTAYLDSGNPTLGAETYAGQFVPSPGVSLHGVHHAP